MSGRAFVFGYILEDLPMGGYLHNDDLRDFQYRLTYHDSILFLQHSLHVFQDHLKLESL